MSTETQARPRSAVQRVAHWFGMEGLPRFSVKFPGSNYVLLVARHDDRIRMVVGTAHPSGEGVGGTHLSLTEREARRIRDGLTQLLGDEETP